MSVIALAWAAAPAQGSISYYGSVSAFDNAVLLAGLPSPTGVSFDSLLGTFFNSVDSNDVVAGSGDVLFTGSLQPGNGSGDPNGTLTVLTNPGGPWPAGDLLARSVFSLGSNYVSGGTIVLTFSSAVRAVAFYTSYTNIGDTITVTAVTASNQTDSHNVAVSQTNLFFEGVVADEGITSITIAAPNTFNERIAVGGFVFSETSSTPEPAPLMLLGAGLCSAAVLRRTNRR
jgi:hypothetical protein